MKLAWSRGQAGEIPSWPASAIWGDLAGCVCAQGCPENAQGVANSMPETGRERRRESGLAVVAVA